MSANLHPTVKQLCDTARISRRMFFNVMKVRRNGCDELIGAIQSGDVTVNLALEMARFDHDGQRLILAEFPTIKPRERAGFVERLRLILKQEQAYGERP